jgi:hypothetical protein
LKEDLKPLRTNVMISKSFLRRWSPAQADVLLAEYGNATGRAAISLEDAERWFLGLPLAERDRVGRKLNDPGIIGWHLQTPRIQDLPVVARVTRRWAKRS